MGSVNWTEQALDSLARIDAWRVSQGWDPIAAEIYDAVTAYFRRHDPEKSPRFLPGKPARRLGEPVDMRSVLVTVRSKQFQVFFRHAERAFHIRRILYPRAR